jgi:hypothetical protein
VFDGAKRRLVTPIEKKEPITPDMLLKLYNSVFKIVLFVLLFYIVLCCIDIEDRSLSGLYFNKIILSYLILSYLIYISIASTHELLNDNKALLNFCFIRTRRINFSASSNKFYIYRQQTNIIYVQCKITIQKEQKTYT